MGQRPVPGAFRCATCDIVINRSPTFHVGIAFCCAGCVAGGPCNCSYDEEEFDRDRHRDTQEAEAVGRALADDERSVAFARR
jgi:hypothetical protein